MTKAKDKPDDDKAGDNGSGGPPPPANLGDGAGNEGQDDGEGDGDDGANGNARERGAHVDAASGRSTAKGQDTSALGEQVDPRTMTSEKDGHRTLAKPVTDPGPYVPKDGMGIRHPDRSKGEHRYSDANEPFTVNMRTSTGHDLGFARPDGNHVTAVKMAPDLAITGAASDVYNKEQGKNLTDVAQRKAAEGREPAPLHE